MRRFILSAVTDSFLLPNGTSLTDRMELLCRLGVRRMVLRERNMPLSEYEKTAKEFIAVCRRNSVISVISHRKDIAERYGADEVQLSITEIREDPKVTERFRNVGVSIHSVEEAKEAESLGASSVTAGHIFTTDCKKGVPERGLDFLKGVVENVDIPVYAIGGIDLDAIDCVYRAGASGACLMSTMMESSPEHISELVKRCHDINRPAFDEGCLALYAITDSRWLRPGEMMASKVEEAILGGATMIQLREKDLGRERLVDEAKECLRVCRSYGVPLIINDDVSVAEEVEADGVHLGQDDIRQLKDDYEGIVGISAHNADEAMRAFELGADYIGCGAVFGTSSKSDTVSLGIDGLKTISKTSKLPIVAIGGIDENNASKLNGTGISGIAVISSIFSKDDVRRATEDLKRIVLDRILD